MSVWSTNVSTFKSTKTQKKATPLLDIHYPFKFVSQSSFILARYCDQVTTKKVIFVYTRGFKLKFNSGIHFKELWARQANTTNYNIKLKFITLADFTQSIRGPLEARRVHG